MTPYDLLWRLKQTYEATNLNQIYTQNINIHETRNSQNYTWTYIHGAKLSVHGVTEP